MNLSFLKAQTPQTLAEKELLDAQRDLLKSQSALEEWQSVVSFNEARIARLQKYVTKGAK